jgi:hypothetical protein
MSLIQRFLPFTPTVGGFCVVKRKLYNVWFL